MSNIDHLQPEVLDMGNDVLLARITLANGEALEAFGWMSAINGNEDSRVRSLTPEETGHYAMNLIVEQNQEEISALTTVKPIPVPFAIPQDSEAVQKLETLASPLPAVPG
jgi:hypothetical protein